VKRTNNESQPAVHARKVSFPFEGGAVAVPGSTIRATTAKTIVLNTMIWDSVLNFLRFWKEGDSNYRGFVPDPCYLSARGVVITRVSSYS
jgi:hypothetical protein